MDTIWFIFMHVVLEGPYYNSHGRRQKIFNRNTYVNYSPLFTLPLITARIQVMEFKFLLIALMVGIVLAQYEASSKTSPRWLKLTSRRSASVRGETSLVVFPTIETSS